MKIIMPFMILIALIYYCCYLFVSTPIVQYSYPDETCVRVIPAEAGSCDNLPRRYEIEWIGRQ